jgi:hypothetical protein
MLLLFAALAALLHGEGQKPPTLDPERVKAAVADLDKAFKEPEARTRIQAIERNASVLDPQVIDRIARGLRDREADVKRSAIEALRGMDHAAAVKELEVAAKTEKPLREDPVLYAALVRAIGQHASKTSIAVLCEDVGSLPDREVVRARILALGRIRDARSVEALIGMMRIAGPGKVDEVMEDFRLSLAVLTGVDQGASPAKWTDWWNGNKGKIEVKPEPPRLSRQLQSRWDVYWGAKPRYERQPRRGERGRGDPEGGS